MLPQNLLCVLLGADARGFDMRLKSMGWNPSLAGDVAGAARLQAGQHFAVGLLVVGGSTAAPQAALEACVRASGDAEWVVACAAGALESPEFRDLVIGHCFVHQVLPIDWRDLELMLQHAAQRAQLRRRDRASPPAVEPAGMVGRSPAMARLRQQIRKLADTEAPVLIGGESGSGKELTARAIHEQSRRANKPFVAVNCGAIAPSLIHAELFGHERGAFTGASTSRHGLIEAAEGGTILLDEIGDLPLELQGNLLRFLQERTISRLGSTRTLQTDVRVIAASNIDLAQAAAAHRFREDLYYRLNVLPIEVPPLRSRMEDVPALADFFFARCLARNRSRARGFSRQASAALLGHSWPGNVRELFNRIQRAVVMADGALISPADLGLASAEAPAPLDLDAARMLAERDAIRATLGRVGRNVTHAARELGVSRMTLYRLMDKHRIALDAD